MISEDTTVPAPPATPPAVTTPTGRPDPVAHDGTARTWDVRPFAPEDRAGRTLDGAPAGLEKNLVRAGWDPEGRRVAAGGGDGTATVWDARTGKLLHKLPCWRRASVTTWKEFALPRMEWTEGEQTPPNISISILIFYHNKV